MFDIQMYQSNPLFGENDFGEKLLLCWIIQTLSFQGVSGLFFFLKKVWAETMSYVNNFGESIGNSQANTAGHCVPVRWERLRRKKREKVDILYWVSERRGWAELSQPQRERTEKVTFFLSLFLSFFLSLDSGIGMVGQQIDRQKGAGSHQP